MKLLTNVNPFLRVLTAPMKWITNYKSPWTSNEICEWGQNCESCSSIEEWVLFVVVKKTGGNALSDLQKKLFVLLQFGSEEF